MPVIERDINDNTNISIFDNFSKLRDPKQALSAESSSHSKLDTILYFIPGAAQGITTVLLGHPLDTSKTRLQAANHPIFHNLKSRSALAVMQRMVTDEGVRSLYRGATPPLLLMTLKRSFQFAFWDMIRQPLEKKTVVTSSTDAVEMPCNSRSLREEVSRTDSNIRNQRVQTTFFKEDQSLTMKYMSSAKKQLEANNYLSGALSGALGALIGCPMHVIKIQTQNNSSGFSAPGAASDNFLRNLTPSTGATLHKVGHNNSFYCTLYILREEGLFGLYRGFRFQVLKDTFFAGTYLGLYETCRSSMEKLEDSMMMSSSYYIGGINENKTSHYNTNITFSDNTKASIDSNTLSNNCSAEIGTSDVQKITSKSARSSVSVFAAGSVACCMTWIVLYPLDTLKTVVQAKRDTTVVNFVRETFLKSPRKVYRGLGASLLRAGPIAGIAMVVYEKSKMWTNSVRGRSV